MISKVVRASKSLFLPFSNQSISSNNKQPLLQKITNHPYWRLCRYDKPTGAMLLYWPVTWGLAIGSASIPSLAMFSMFFMGAWTSRSAGCIINDYFDRDFDRQVQRTKLRPLASGQVSVKEAAIVMFLNLFGGLFVLTQLPLSALLATFAVLPVAALYPLAKRYTHYPQLVLGLAFNSGAIIGALTLDPTATTVGAFLPIYAMGVLWTLIYDTVYAFQDINDDKKLGLKSTAITWQHQTKTTFFKILGVSSLGVSALLLMNNLAYAYSIPGILIAHLFMANEIQKLDLKNKQQCAKFFKKTNYFGLIILLSLICKNVFQNKDKKKEDKQH